MKTSLLSSLSWSQTAPQKMTAWRLLHCGPPPTTTRMGGYLLFSVQRSVHSQRTYLCLLRWPGLLHAVIWTAELLHSGHTHSFIHCGFNVARLPHFSRLSVKKKKELFKKAVQGRPVGLNTRQDETAGLTDNTSHLLSPLSSTSVII